MDTELAGDQRIDDARSLTFDSAPLTGDIEILGAPAVTLDLAVDQPVAFLAVRLNDVDPEGLSRRVTYAVLNLTHRDSHECPTPLTPGQRYRIRIQLRDHAYAFKASHRIRVAISTTYWPLIWPSPAPVRLTLYAGNSTLELPVRPRRASDAQLASFGEKSDFSAGGQMRPATRPTNKGQAPTKDFEWQLPQRKLLIRSTPGDVVGTGSAVEVSEIRDDDPTSAKLEYRRSAVLRGHEQNVRVETELRLTLTNEDFLLTGIVRALDNDSEVFSRTWDWTIPRQLV